mgnify:FL=1
MHDAERVAQILSGQVPIKPRRYLDKHAYWMCPKCYHTMQIESELPDEAECPACKTKYKVFSPDSIDKGDGEKVAQLLSGRVPVDIDNGGGYLWECPCTPKKQGMLGKVPEKEKCCWCGREFQLITESGNE